MIARYAPKAQRAPPAPRPSIDIVRALEDKLLLGAALGDPVTWSRWLSALRAAFALPMSTSDVAAFKEVSGNREPPTGRVDQLWATVGRRSGKSRIAAALAVFAAAFMTRRLAHGETGHVLVLAASQDQARVVFNYCLGFLQASPILSQEVLGKPTLTEIRLRNGNVISVHANSYRTVRGRTMLCVVFDKVAQWRDETSASPDLETYRAVLPSLATTKGMLIGISSPYRKIGLLYQKHRDAFGQNDPTVLVVAGPSRQFNPTLDQAIIDAAIEDDPEAARAEWEGEFRSDIAAFLDDEIIERVVDYARPLEIPPRQGLQYAAGVDPSGGRHDHFCLAIGHREGRGDGSFFVTDVVRGRAPPFDPKSVVSEYAALLKDYKVHQVVGENYAAEWVKTSFEKQGVRYIRSELNKSQAYLEMLPLFMRQNLSIPDHPKLTRELRLLERRTSRMRRDVVDHGVNGSDDYANALALVLRCMSASFVADMSWIDGGENENEDGRETHSATMLKQYLFRRGIPC